MLAHSSDELLLDSNFRWLLRALYLLDHVSLNLNGKVESPLSMGGLKISVH